MTNFYEMTYILNPVLEEERFSEMVEFVNKLVTDNGGEIVEVDEWGIRKFAYEIDKKGNGYYVNMYFNISGDSIEPIERNMRCHDDKPKDNMNKDDAKIKHYYEVSKKGEAPTIKDEKETVEEDN